MVRPNSIAGLISIICRFVGEWYHPETGRGSPTAAQIATASANCFAVGGIYIGFTVMASGLAPSCSISPLTSPFFVQAIACVWWCVGGRVPSVVMKKVQSSGRISSSDDDEQHKLIYSVSHALSPLAVCHAGMAARARRPDPSWRDRGQKWLQGARRRRSVRTRLTTVSHGSLLMHGLLPGQRTCSSVGVQVGCCQTLACQQAKAELSLGGGE